jgi:hypothetical protein
MRIHSKVIRDGVYARVGKPRMPAKNPRGPRPVCPKCGIYYLRSVWTRNASYNKREDGVKMGKTEIVIGKWCQGCGYFVQTYKKPEGA